MPEITATSLQAVADWNAEKGLQLLRWEHHEKNHDRSRVMLKDAGRHLRTHDNLCRLAWVMQHTKHPNKRR